MPVEVGEVEVVAGQAEQNGAAAAAPAAPPPSDRRLASEVERSLALERSRDLRLRAD